MVEAAPHRLGILVPRRVAGTPEMGLSTPHPRPKVVAEKFRSMRDDASAYPEQ
jgi:hypothetical protein